MIKIGFEFKMHISMCNFKYAQLMQ